MSKPFTFVGRGTRAEIEPRIGDINPWGNRIGPWVRSQDGATVAPADEWSTPAHPAGYDADPDLVEAVNTAILLRKPLLLTGSPGVGKSDLAERIGWELNLSPVLRFEAQSLSEANDLFYRFDLVSQMAAAQLLRFAGDTTSHGEAVAAVRPHRFLSFGALGQAILRSNPNGYRDLAARAFPAEVPLQARPSVVLIDEIDKAARDFPNDLLNGIERFRFAIRELPEAPEIAAPEDEALRPIVLITSNSERDLPAPFLRRCTYFNIPDPDRARLQRIVLARVFPERLHGKDGNGGAGARLPALYQEMLAFFMDYRDQHANEHVHMPGVGELIDWSCAVKRSARADESGSLAVNAVPVRAALSTIAKRKEDGVRLLDFFRQRAAPARS